MARNRFKQNTAAEYTTETIPRMTPSAIRCSISDFRNGLKAPAGPTGSGFISKGYRE
jgi:hypothetical protein